MAQHIDKQITDVLSTINALKDGTKLGSIAPQGFVQPSNCAKCKRIHKWAWLRVSIKQLPGG